MEKFILRNIEFNKCSSCLVLSGLLWVISVVMVPIKSIPQKPFQAVSHFVELCLSFYIFLGFIKFSILEKKDSFKKLVFAAMTLSVIAALIGITAILTESKEFFNYSSVLVAIEWLSLFYAFKSIDSNKIHFKKLSSIYLYLSLFSIPTSVALLFGKERVTMMMPQILMKPFLILTLVWAGLIVYAWYLKIRVFKEISTHLY